MKTYTNFEKHLKLGDLSIPKDEGNKDYQTALREVLWGEAEVAEPTPTPKTTIQAIAEGEAAVREAGFSQTHINLLNSMMGAGMLTEQQITKVRAVLQWSMTMYLAATSSPETFSAENFPCPHQVTEIL
jgi:hypothetical protein